MRLGSLLILAAGATIAMMNKGDINGKIAKIKAIGWGIIAGRHRAPDNDQSKHQGKVAVHSHAEACRAYDRTQQAQEEVHRESSRRCDLERLIDQAGRDKVFARALSYGWTGPLPTWAWNTIANEIIAENITK